VRFIDRDGDRRCWMICRGLSWHNSPSWRARRQARYAVCAA